MCTARAYELFAPAWLRGLSPIALLLSVAFTPSSVRMSVTQNVQGSACRHPRQFLHYMLQSHRQEAVLVCSERYALRVECHDGETHRGRQHAVPGSACCFGEDASTVSLRVIISLHEAPALLVYTVCVAIPLGTGIVESELSSLRVLQLCCPCVQRKSQFDSHLL